MNLNQNNGPRSTAKLSELLPIRRGAREEVTGEEVTAIGLRRYHVRLMLGVRSIPAPARCQTLMSSAATLVPAGQCATLQRALVDL